jgi:ABC-type amino acid transport substrate-binding protein
LTRRPALLASGLALLLAAAAWAAAARPPAPRAGDLERLRAQRYLIAAVPAERPPFGWTSAADGRPSGFDVDLARALAAALIGPEAEVRFVPLSSAAEADLVFGRPPGEGTTRPYYTGSLGLLAKRGSRVGSLRDLDGRVLALVGGTSAERQVLAAAAAAGARPVPEFFPRYPDALAALAEGRADALGGELAVLRALRRLDPNTRIVAAGFGEAGYAVAAPAGLLPAADAALARLIADEPAWDRRLRRWGLRPRPPGRPPRSAATSGAARRTGSRPGGPERSMWAGGASSPRGPAGPGTRP